MPLAILLNPRNTYQKYAFIDKMPIYSLARSIKTRIETSRFGMLEAPCES
jgi:hypothetical protein